MSCEPLININNLLPNFFSKDALHSTPAIPIFGDDRYSKVGLYGLDRSKSTQPLASPEQLERRFKVLEKLHQVVGTKPNDRSSGYSKIELTEAQKKVLLFDWQAFPNKVIGSKLGVTEKTIERHAGDVAKKLGPVGGEPLARGLFPFVALMTGAITPNDVLDLLADKILPKKAN